MKKIFILLFLFSFKYTPAQNILDFGQLKLVQPADYKAADNFALYAADYLLSTPFEKNNPSRLKSLQFLMKWMSGTPDYGFTIDPSAGKIVKGSNELTGLYMAAMAKYSLENKSSADLNLVKINALKLLLAYCENPANNMRMSKGLKKLSEANKKGELEKSL